MSTNPGRGDESELFALHHSRLVAQLSRRLGGDRGVAEDACTLAWVQLLRLQPERGDTLYGWLYVTAKHEAYRILRERAREHAAHQAAAAGSDPRASDPFETISDLERIELMRRLSAAQRLTLSLRAAGYSYKEISVATGHTYTWVNRHLTEGTAKLRQLNQDQ